MPNDGHKVEFIGNGVHGKVFLDGKPLKNVIAFDTLPTQTQGIKGVVTITLHASELLIKAEDWSKQSQD